MTPERSRDLAHRYVAWLRRHSLAVVAAAAIAVTAAALLIAFRLPLRADFSYLLPSDAPAVRDLHRLEARVAEPDSALIVVASHDPAARAAAAADMAARVRALPRELVSRVEDDDATTRDFVGAHRNMFVPLSDLEAARGALRERIEQAKLDANPLFIELDDDERAASEAATRERLDELRTRRDDADKRLARSSFVSADRTHQLLVVKAPFRNTDADTGRRLLAGLRRARHAVLAAHPDVEIGLTGGVVTTAAEHDALVRGMVLSALVTAVLVGASLVLYLRSLRLVMSLTITLVVGTTVAFGASALTVGHLNAATAFLGAIIAGNGVNYSILLIARYNEERRRHPADPAMARALVGTLRPTLVASLGAAIAYGSLAATSFRGFADFAIIGAVGMLLCWIASFTLLPVLILRLAAAIRRPRERPVIGSTLAWLLAFRHPGRVLAVTGVIALGLGWITYRYVATDPFEYDIKNLRSHGDEAVEARAWMQRSDAHFGRGISGQTYVAVDDLADVERVVTALQRADRPGRPPTIGRIRSILEVVPPDQEARLAVLSEIRTLLDGPALAELDDDARDELAALRPPDQLRAITPADLPAELADKLRERDGRVGLLIGVRPAPDLDEWNGRDLIRFASAVRRIDLGDGRTITTSGSSVIFADIVAAIENDGLRVTLVAALGLVVMVLLVVGKNLRAASVLVATTMGALGLIATCAVIGIKVNFLDFVALPITLGLGVDYAINVAYRHHGEAYDPVATLRTSGSAVFLCSLTTIIGYGSLLVSDNLAIRGFGLASLIGEICCLITALVVVPAMVSLRAHAGAGPAALDAAA